MYKIWNEDCIQGMKTHIKDESIDLIITDPPYGINGATLDKGRYARDEGKVIEGYIDVPSDLYGTFSKQWITECARCLKPGGSIYIISGYTQLHHILNALHSTSLQEVNHLIWKFNFAPVTTKKFVSSHYHILYWYKQPDNKRTFNTNCRFTDITDSYHDRESVIQIGRDYKPGEIKNKNQLPEELIERLMFYSSNKDDTIMDPFMGGFTTAKVALKYGRNVIGFELNQNAYNHFYPLMGNIEPQNVPDPLQPDSDTLSSRQIIRLKRNIGRDEKKLELLKTQNIDAGKILKLQNKLLKDKNDLCDVQNKKTHELIE